MHVFSPCRCPLPSDPARVQGGRVRLPLVRGGSMSKHEFPESEKRIIRARSKGVCEGCGKAPATEMHHRQYRSRGGLSVASNGLWLCGWGNHTGCHGIAHTAIGEQLGWSVRSFLFLAQICFDDLGIIFDFFVYNRTWYIPSIMCSWMIPIKET